MNNSHAQLLKKYGQACPTYSQLEMLDGLSSSSSPSIQPPTQSPTKLPTPPHPLHPDYYTPTGYEYNFRNFGLPHYEGNYQHYYLINGVTWLPNVPATVILAMNNLHVIKVGLEQQEVMKINSIMFEMHRALSPHQYNT